MLSNKRSRSTNKDGSKVIITNISFTQVQNDFSSINKINIPKNNYFLRSQPVKVKEHRTPPKVVSRKKQKKTLSSIKTRPTIALKNNSRSNITTYKDLESLVKKANDKLLVVDKEIYYRYQHTKFKDYVIIYTDTMMNDYKFMVKENNEKSAD